MSKKQWKSIDVPLQFSIKSDWSHEEDDSPLSDVHTIRSSLPTKTNATRQTAELDNISENGPFILNFANMPFDASETDLRQFFRAYEICGMELNNPRRGCGHIVFTNLSDLAGAWKMNEKTFMNRPIRLSIPLKDDINRQQAMGNKPKFQSQQKQQFATTTNSDDMDNWRVRKPQQHSSQKTDSAFVTKSDDKSNWRSRGARTEDNSVDTNAGDLSVWRTRAARDPAAAVKAPQESTSNIDNQAWRTREPTAVKAQDGGDKAGAWRSRGVREPEATKAAEASDDRANWRQRGTEASKVDGESGSDTWRKGRVGGGAVTSKSDDNGSVAMTVVERGSVQEDTGDAGELSGDSKKRSVFGDARPVDTSAKDLEIEAKLEQTKSSNDASRTDPVSSKSNAWNNSTASSVTSARKPQPVTQSMEWRDKKPTIATKEPVTAEPPLPKKPEPILAPPPAVNVWHARMQKRVTPPTRTDIHTNNEQKKVEPVTKVVTERIVEEEKQSGERCAEEKAEEVKPVEEAVKLEVSGPMSTMADTKSGQSPRPLVVISVKGPYIDPKSVRVPVTAMAALHGTSTVPSHGNTKLATGSANSWAQLLRKD